MLKCGESSMINDVMIGTEGVERGLNKFKGIVLTKKFEYSQG